ncbi:MAG TPA: hypothetical protein VK666_27455 [Chryseolinea sp.]|nr:hypothetical protein [Chryseolinea sp.]
MRKKRKTPLTARSLAHLPAEALAQAGSSHSQISYLLSHLLPVIVAEWFITASAILHIVPPAAFVPSLIIEDPVTAQTIPDT